MTTATPARQWFADNGGEPSMLDACARLKRFGEWYDASSEFRDRSRERPADVAVATTFDLDVAEVVAMVALLEGGDLVDDTPDTVRHYADFAESIAKQGHDRRSARTTAHPQLARWRRRQRARLELELGPAATERNPLISAALELSVGCSVNCWFCGVSALDLNDVVRYDVGSAARFRDVLGALRGCCGDALASGALYWATDPFDNPDYERFLEDWLSVVGSRPQTTTAQPLRHDDRLRRLIDESWNSPMGTVRISVLSTAVLRRLHSLYAPDQLLATRLEMRTPTARTGVQAAGRARDVRDGRRAERVHADPSGTATIACMSGFLVNLVSGTVQLISPCAASDEWPNGYRVFAEASFTDGTEFAGALTTILDRLADDVLTEDEAVRLREHATCRPAFDGFDVVTRSHTLKLRSRPGLARIGDLLRHGDPHTVGEILVACEADGVAHRHALQTLTWLDDLAVLDDRDHALRTVTGVRAPATPLLVPTVAART